ncbi:hypothetical protein [Mesorhizobium sp. LjNodule214]|uniref:hypothetical protein n=1 Tax=Mesorhizobium sp. LjNodule214 TaxID=3342252 RepID=UPI003ECC1DE1
MSRTAFPTMPSIAAAAGCAAIVLFLTFGPNGPSRAAAGISSRAAATYVKPAPGIQPTRIEVDGDAHSIRFYIDGKQVVLLDAAGFKE